MRTRRQQAPPVWERSIGGLDDRTVPISRRRRRDPHLASALMREGGGSRAGRRGRSREALGRLRDSEMFQSLKTHPVRSGIVGLAVLGTAVPLGIEQAQSRVDESHERTVFWTPGMSMDDATVSAAWRESIRDRTIEEQIERHAQYGVDRELAEQIYDAAEEHGIDPVVAFGLVRAESSFKNSSTSVVGAVGLTQLMPRTASWMVPGTSVRDLRNPEVNLDIGFKYLRYLLDKYDGNEDLALLAYNRGPGTVDGALRRGANPDNGYAAFVRGEEGHGHALFTR